MVKNVLFDLDGTLLPMDQRVFVERYLRELCAEMSPRGLDPDRLVRALWEGIGAMVRNDGSGTNESVFWETFEPICPTSEEDRAAMDIFYRTAFHRVRESCGFEPQAAATVRELRRMGLRVALATNPVFPRAATEARIGWAGLAPEDFELITTYETSKRCKPHPEYYAETCHRLGIDPRETVMAGNDTGEDTSGAALGIRPYILTHSLIERPGNPVTSWPHGDFRGLIEYVKSLMG